MYKIYLLVNIWQVFFDRDCLKLGSGGKRDLNPGDPLIGAPIGPYVLMCEWNSLIHVTLFQVDVVICSQ